MSKQTFFSGIQPSGNLHIGNYLGAIKRWVDLQNTSKINPSSSSVIPASTPVIPAKAGIHKIEEATDIDSRSESGMTNEFIFCIVDLHAITVPQDPKILRQKNLEIAALYIASGLDPVKSKIFIQSENPDHAYLTWIFDTVTPIGWLERMIQFKEKSKKQGERASMGLFNYPVLQAADILLYDTDFVPVGEDQVQHIELACDIAERFNRTFCHPERSPALRGAVEGSHRCVFTIPKPLVDKHAARIMSLQNPSSKMSKSDADLLATINLLDSPDEINKKISRAVTDSGNEVVYREDKPALSNLLTIYSQFTDMKIADIEKKYTGSGYAGFKKDLVEAVISALTPIQKKYQELTSDKQHNFHHQS